MVVPKTQIPDYPNYGVFSINGDIVRICLTEEQSRALLRKPIDFQLLIDLSPTLRATYDGQTGYLLSKSWVVEAANLLRVEARDLDMYASDTGKAK